MSEPDSQSQAAPTTPTDDRQPPTRQPDNRILNGGLQNNVLVEDSMKSSLTPDDDVTKMKKLKRKLAKAKVQQRDTQQDLIK